MAVQNISALFENNLRKISEVGVGTLHAALSTSGDRLGQGIVYAKGGDEHLIYTIPKDSIAPKFYVLVDEAFDAGTTATITTIVDGDAIVTSLDVATVAPTVSALVDTYFDSADGFKIVLNQDVTVGKLRVVAEYISASTNNSIFVDVGA
ncbi:MAG: hypothetical protein DRG30_09485 [Epsilonproteobacteria bacterium]|nr:MAG: hypothetical protein DRG30_09485 [Campylobacterota bacterium]